MRPAHSLRLTALLAGLALTFGACSDAPLTADDLPAPAPSAAPTLSLLDDLGLLRLDSLHLLVRFRGDAEVEGGAYESNRVFQRNRIFQRNRVFQRNSYVQLVPGVAITVSLDNLTSLVEALLALPEVAGIEPDLTMTTRGRVGATWTVSSQAKSWGVDAIGAPTSYFVSGDGRDRNGVPNVDLFVVDSGTQSADVNVVQCVSFLGGTARPCASSADPTGHGTSVAGIAAAKDDTRGLVGVAPGTPVTVLQVIDGQGNGEESDILQALEYVAARKAARPGRPMVVNLSLGARVGTLNTMLDDAVRALVAQGVVVVVSAGNEGIDASLYSPAHVAEAITVGAYDRTRTLAAYSNRGPVLDLLAPGTDLEVLAPGANPGVLTRDSGTSMAAPHVAGAAVLVLTQYPSYTPAQVRDLLVQRASTLTGTSLLGLPLGAPQKGLNVSGQGGNAATTN